MTNTIEQTGDAAGQHEGKPKQSATKSARTKRATVATRAETKADLILKRLRSPKGATLAQLIDATGWQAHSVRGYLSGTVKKKLGLLLVSETGKDGARRYRVAESAPNATNTVSNAGPDAA